MVGGSNIYDTAQTGYIYEDEIPACVRVVNHQIKCNDINDCRVETCYFRPTGKPVIRQMIDIQYNKGLDRLRKKFRRHNTDVLIT